MKEKMDLLCSILSSGKDTTHDHWLEEEERNIGVDVHVLQAKWKEKKSLFVPRLVVKVNTTENPTRQVKRRLTYRIIGEALASLEYGIALYH